METSRDLNHWSRCKVNLSNSQFEAEKGMGENFSWMSTSTAGMLRHPRQTFLQLAKWL